MEDLKQQSDEIELKPIPIEQDQDMKNTEEESSGLVPLPIESTESNLNPNENAIPDVNDDDNDTEMKDKSNEAPNNHPPSDEMIVEEEEEEGGIIEEVIEEEEEESGDIVMPPPPPVTTNNVATEPTSAPAPKPQPKPSSTQQAAKDQDKDRARSHPITTDINEGARYLNISLMKEWSHAEVLAWLTHRFGLWGQQYVPVFSNKKIDGSRLILLTEEELKTSFGVTKPLHLVRMARDIHDASRPIHSIHKLIAPCYMDGGNAAAKMMRFGPKEVYAFALRVPGLKMHAQTFLDRQINGRVLLECSDGQLVTAMKNEQITLIDAQGILEVLDTIKKEGSASADTGTGAEYSPIQTVYEVWNEMCKVNEIRFKLLPQHIRDYSKPAPTYYPPPQHRTYGQGAHTGYATQRRNSGYGGRQYGGRTGGNESEESGSPALYQIKSVTEWNTEDCITWLGQIKESKVDLRVRYTPHFEQVKMTGPILLNMTPSTLSAICCITTKTHLKQLVKAIDKIRDHLVFNGFGQQAHVKDFTSKYGGGYNFPAVRYQRSESSHEKKRGNEQSQRAQIYAQQQKLKRESMQQDEKMAEGNARGGGAAQTQEQQIEGQQEDASVAKCFVCGKTGNVMRCSQCKSAFYCSREHQVSDWARHSKDCQK